MEKCLEIVFSGKLPENFLRNTIQKNAQKLSLEGMVRAHEDEQFKLVICGSLEAVDAFVDLFHKSLAKVQLNNVEIEPFLKDRDYRGVFRVIE